MTFRVATDTCIGRSEFSETMDTDTTLNAIESEEKNYENKSDPTNEASKIEKPVHMDQIKLKEMSKMIKKVPDAESEEATQLEGQIEVLEAIRDNAASNYIDLLSKLNTTNFD